MDSPLPKRVISQILPESLEGARVGWGWVAGVASVSNEPLSINENVFPLFRVLQQLSLPRAAKLAPESGNQDGGGEVGRQGAQECGQVCAGLLNVS